MIALSDVATTLALWVGILFVSRFVWNYLRSPLKSYPGPAPTSFTNLWRMRDVYRGRCDQTQIALHRKYGPAVRMGPNMLSLSDPSLLSQVYNTKSPWLKVDQPLSMTMTFLILDRVTCIMRTTSLSAGCASRICFPPRTRNGIRLLFALSTVCTP